MEYMGTQDYTNHWLYDAYSDVLWTTSEQMATELGFNANSYPAVATW